MRHAALYQPEHLIPRRFMALRAILTATILSCCSLAQTAAAQEVKPGGNEGIKIRGILSGTLYLQDALFGTGNGQRAEFVTQENDGWFHGGDVRSTRLGLDFTGPDVVGNWRAGGTIEIDFFGGFTSAGAFGDEQPVPACAWPSSISRTAVRRCVSVRTGHSRSATYRCRRRTLVFRSAGARAASLAGAFRAFHSDKS
jgi:hypothetical protein